MPEKFTLQCAQRGCVFDWEEIEQPEKCPVCNNPFHEVEQEPEDALALEKEMQAAFAEEPESTGSELALKEWLKDYTWIQEDGSIQFGNPRERPEKLAVDPREFSVPRTESIEDKN